MTHPRKYFWVTIVFFLAINISSPEPNQSLIQEITSERPETERVQSETQKQAKIQREKEITKANKRLFDQFFLVRPAEWFGKCEGKLAEEAILIIGPGTKLTDIKAGDEFFIIKHSSGIVKGILTRIAPSCAPSLGVDNLPMGLLKTEDEIDWGSSYDALIAIKGKALVPLQVGSVKHIKGDPENKTYIDQIRSNIPITNKFNVEDIVRVTPPLSDRRYAFASVRYYNPKEYEIAGDNASKTAGFLFSIENKRQRLIIKINDLTRIFSITDLDKNGIYEVAGHNSEGCCGGSYEVRLFDGEKFYGARKMLYRWMD